MQEGPNTGLPCKYEHGEQSSTDPISQSIDLIDPLSSFLSTITSKTIQSMRVSVGVASFHPRGEDKVQSVSRVCQHTRCREADFSFDIISTL